MTAPLGSWSVGADEAGQRIDLVLARRLGEPRARSQARLAAGRVSLDGLAADKSARVAAGQRIEVAEDAAPVPAAAPPPLAVRHLDEHLAVVVKPAGTVVHAGAGVSDATLVDALRAQGLAPQGGDDPDRPGIVHRLDRGTSGLLVVARSHEAYAGLVDMLRRREVTRGYWALVEGCPRPERATVDAPIARDPRRRTRFTTAADGRPAVTHYDVVEALGPASRLELRLATGRTHQVRVHMAAIGHPVCGDGVYGAQTALAERLGLSRPALHAERLAFSHPVTGRPVDVVEPAPADLAEALSRLRSSDAADHG